MVGEKKICCSIMLCQMTSILSGCAMLYLAVIVVIPAQDELEAGFHRDPVMCTTIKAEDIAAGGKKVDCKWSTCGEWCLSKSSNPCMQIHVMARNNGSAVKFNTCFDIFIDKCSALNVNLTISKKCKMGECKELTGLYNCSKDGHNECRDISPAYNCGGGSNINRDSVRCTNKKCEERLSGVYICKNGVCNRLDHVKHYYKDCERKCTSLRLSDINVVIFNGDNFIATKCTSVTSTSNNTINELNEMEEWKEKKKVLFLYCTYYHKTHGERGYDLHTGDCFNASLGDAEKVNTLTNFLDVLDYTQELYNQSDFLIEPEETLRIMNTTQLKINKEGCVNSLKKECKSFFATHASDGRDGLTQNRFPCFYTDKDSNNVVGKYSPDMTYIYLVLASYVPVSLFVFSCCCLFLCSKSVGVDENGHLQVVLLQGSGQGGKTHVENEWSFDVVDNE